MVTTHFSTGAVGTTGAYMVNRSRLDKYAMTPSAGEGPYAQTGVLVIPGGGGLETSWQTGGTTPSIMSRIQELLCTDGASWVKPYRCINMASGWTYGNDVQTTRENDSWSQGVANHQMKTAKVHLVGGSMGTVCALTFARMYPTKVASVSCILPLVDLVDATPRINTYGLPLPTGVEAYNGAVPSNRDPIQNMSTYTGIPIKMWGTTDDSVCNYSRAVAFAAGVPGGKCEMVSLGISPPVGYAIFGHSAEKLNPQDVVDHIVANTP